jgi:predicted glycosyltransferase
MMLVADSPLAPFFTLPAHCDFVKLPTIVKVDSGIWESPELSLPIQRIRELRAHLLKDILITYLPDAVVVDHMPCGAMGELIIGLKSLRRKSPNAQVILGLRDILGAPETIIRQWRFEGSYQAIADYYDAVFVYGSQALYDAARAYQFPNDVLAKVHYCGYVFANGASEPEAPLALQFPSPKPLAVLTAAGGGSDAFFLMDAMLEAIRFLGDAIPFNTWMFTGPFMPQEERHRLVEKARALPVIVKWKEEEFRQFYPQVDLVVSMAGYNTICEILGFGKKAIVVPRAGPSAEQSIRSQILHDNGLVRAIHPRDLTPQGLAQAIVEQLYTPDSNAGLQKPDLHGAVFAAQFILQRLGGGGR